jgi:aminopeptidase N
MNLPHSPYLFFMGVGEYSVIKDSYKGKEVSYYIEKDYAPVARKIFGETPAMIGFFEKITGVPFAWAKYSQIVGRDYVSGAMENTTATLHGENAYQNARQLIDENTWEDVISHELFHQWFGDLVTAESWSNITVNESMATYSETLWREFRYGKDVADEHIEENRQTYLSDPANAQKNLVRFYYSNKEDVFDQVSYPKGAAILHMLRNYVGDSAFLKALNKYLLENKFKNAEATQLRLAFEDVTGKDLNWFWNQWYYGSGHPKLKIDYNYTANASKVIVEQLQTTGKIFTLPIAIDVYTGNGKKRYDVWIKNKIDTFTFVTPTKPTLINVDADKVLLLEKTDNKSAENYVEQWKHATNYLDRKEALEYFSSKKMNELAEGLNDNYHELREFTLTNLMENKNLITAETLSKIEALANSDPSTKVQAGAIEILALQNDKKYLPLFTKYVNDSSYSVAGAALEGLIRLDPSNAYAIAKKYRSDARGKLASVILVPMLSNSSEDDYDFISKQYDNTLPGQEKLQLTSYYADYLGKITDTARVKEGVDKIIKFRNVIPEQYRSFTDQMFKQVLDKLSKQERASGNIELSNYIEGVLK